MFRMKKEKLTLNNNIPYVKLEIKRKVHTADKMNKLMEGLRPDERNREEKEKNNKQKEDSLMTVSCFFIRHSHVVDLQNHADYLKS